MSLLLCLMLFYYSANAQVQDSLHTKQETEDNVKYPVLQIKGLFQARK